MSEEIIIRLAGPQDVTALTRLCAHLGYPTEAPLVAVRLEKILADSGQVVFVAEHPSSGVIGWVHVMKVINLESDPYGEIGGLVVDPQCRRGGAGRKLMAAAEAWSRSQGLYAVRLRSNVLRHEAHLFYQSIGYHNVKSQYTFHKDLN
jgi:GNAT superfamily N-acetyltransferase